MHPRHALRRTRRARHGRTAPRPSVARLFSVALTAVLAFAVGGTATAYINLQNNIRGGDVDNLIVNARPTPKHTDPEDTKKGRPLNILLIGSDDRSGSNAEIGGYFAGQRSDTTIIMHISAERDRVELVSIPRDLMVEIPNCKMTNGKETAATFDQFNAAFAFGADVGEDVESAAACTIATVEKLTDVYIDGYFVVDFSGFITMIDAIGGVDICVEQEIYSPKANNLRLQPGVNHLDGRKALDFARARTGKGLGDGSDLRRIERQQMLLAQTVNKVLSMNLLTQQVELYRFLDAATSSLAADKEFASIPTLAGLAYSLRGIKAKDITFLTPKVAAYPQNPNRVIFTAEAETVWEKLARDEPIKERKPRPSASGSPSSSPSSGPVDDDVLTPEDVKGVCG